MVVPMLMLAVQAELLPFSTFCELSRATHGLSPRADFTYAALIECASTAVSTKTLSNNSACCNRTDMLARMNSVYPTLRLPMYGTHAAEFYSLRNWECCCEGSGWYPDGCSKNVQPTACTVKGGSRCKSTYLETGQYGYKCNRPLTKFETNCTRNYEEPDNPLEDDGVLLTQERVVQIVSGTHAPIAMFPFDRNASDLAEWSRKYGETYRSSSDVVTYKDALSYLDATRYDTARLELVVNMSEAIVIALKRLLSMLCYFREEVYYEHRGYMIQALKNRCYMLIFAEE